MPRLEPKQLTQGQDFLRKALPHQIEERLLCVNLQFTSLFFVSSCLGVVMQKIDPIQSCLRTKLLKMYHYTKIKKEPLTPEESRGLKIVEHLKKHLELKEAHPDAAYVELKESAELTWWNHDLVEEWTEIVFKIHQRGKASINEMIHRTELEVQMAKEKSPYKDQVVYLRGHLEFWQDKKTCRS